MSTSDLQDIKLGVDFGFGFDTKTDPKLVLKSKLLRMENARINKIGLVDKRPGTKSLPNVDTSGNAIGSGSALGILDNELLELTEGQLYSFGQATGLNFMPKGAVTPVGVNRRIVQSNLSNLQSVNAASVNGVTLYAWDSIVTNSLGWMVVDEMSGTVYQTGSQLGAQQPQIVVANGNLILLYGTTSGHVVAKVFSSSAPWQAPSMVTLAGITLTGTIVFGAATDGTSTVMVAATTTTGGITTATYNASTLALVASAVTTPGFGPPFISVAYLSVASAGCNWAIYYPDLVGNVWVLFYGTSLATTFGYTPIFGTAANPFGPGCCRQSPSNSDQIIIYATRYNPQATGQGLLQSYCGQAVWAFGVRPSDGLFSGLFAGNVFCLGAQLASFPWATGIGTSANILVQYQVDPTVAAQFPNGEIPLSVQPQTFIMDADTAAVVGRGPTGQAMVASQSLSGSVSYGSYQVLPRAYELDQGAEYLVPEDDNTVLHVNGTDLNNGTASVGPGWVKTAPPPPFAPHDMPIPSVGPFGDGTILSPGSGGSGPWPDHDLFTLPTPSPLNFAPGQSFSLTIIASIPSNLGGAILNSNPLFIEAGDVTDANGFWLEANLGSVSPSVQGQINFATLNASVGEVLTTDGTISYTELLGKTLVISFGYDGTTNNLFLKVNNRTIVTGNLGAVTQSPVTASFIGNFFDGRAYYPLDGQIYEVLASKNIPSDALFTSIYEAVQDSLPRRFLIGQGASLNIESQDDEFVYAQGIGELLLDYGQSRPVFIEQLASNAHVTGGMLQRYDGQTIAEHGFGLNPEFLQVQGATTISGEVASLIDIAFTPPTLAAPFSVTTITFPPGNQMAPGEWWAMDDSGAVLGGSGSNLSAAPTKYFWYRVNGQGTDPAPLPSGGTVVDILSTDTSLQIAQKTCARLSFAIINSLKSVTTLNGSAVLEFQIATPYPAGGSGLTTIPTVQSGKFRVFETVAAVNGTSTSSRCYSIACCPGVFIKPGQFWRFNLGIGHGLFGSVSCVPYVWYKVDGVGSDPGNQPILSSNPGSAVSFGIEVDITSADTASTVATKTWSAINLNTSVNPGGTRGAAGTIPASGATGNFVFLSLTTNSGVAAPDLLVPEIGANVSVGAGALGLPLGEGTAQTSSYAVVGVYAEADGKGNVHRSAPSDPLIFVAPRSPVADARVTYQFPNLRLTNKANVILELYRTAANGSTLDKQTPSLSPVANNPAANLTAINDSLQDDRDPGDSTSLELTSNEALYTTGGALAHEVLSPCSILHIHRGRAWASGFADDRLRIQASLLQPPGFGVAWSKDASHVIEMPPDGGDVSTLGTLDEKLIIFKQSLIYFTAGDGPDATGQNGAFLTPERINAAVGCSAPKSVVEIDAGLMFKSTKGMMLLSRKMEVTHLEAADGFNALTITSASKRDGDEHVLFTTLEGPTLVYNYLRDAWGIDTISGALDSILYAPQTPGQVAARVLYYLTADGKVHAENPGDYTDDGVPVSRLIQTAWIKPADQAQGSAIIREALWLGFWPALQYETLTIEYNYGQIPASVLTFNLTGSQGVWGSSTPWGADPLWGGSGTDILQWSARPPVNKVETMRFTLQDIAPFVTNRAASVAHLDLVCGVRRGSMKLPSAQQIGS